MSDSTIPDSAAPEHTGGPAVLLEHVAKRFGDHAAIDDVTLAIPRGRITALLGPSGSGKSTLLRLITGLSRPDAGSVRVLGEELSTLPRGGLLKLRRRMGMLFQDNALFQSLTVVDNVAFPLVRVARVPTAEAKRRALALLEQVGLPGLGERRPDELSGGQRKRVALARALALEPEVVLFDEPTSGLDPQTSAAIDALLRETQRRLGTTFVVITHDIISAAAIADHVGLLVDGKLRAFGSKDEVWSSTDPQVRAFLDRRLPAG
ncbi:MAG: ATP-binding cassette domain-containing protein [Deltaproteobacteria bacterium]|nr:ATP-binding cassette domain-containing protein [Deltaproteobacteria bacterium]